MATGRRRTGIGWRGWPRRCACRCSPMAKCGRSTTTCVVARSAGWRTSCSVAAWSRVLAWLGRSPPGAMAAKSTRCPGASCCRCCATSGYRPGASSPALCPGASQAVAGHAHAHLSRSRRAVRADSPGKRLRNHRPAVAGVVQPGGLACVAGLAAAADIDEGAGAVAGFVRRQPENRPRDFLRRTAASSGMPPFRRSIRPGSPPLAWISVSISPGRTALTRIPPPPLPGQTDGHAVDGALGGGIVDVFVGRSQPRGHRIR